MADDTRAAAGGALGVARETPALAIVLAAPTTEVCAIGVARAAVVARADAATYEVAILEMFSEKRNEIGEDDGVDEIILSSFLLTGELVEPLCRGHVMLATCKVK